MNSNNWEQLLSALTETMSTEDLQLSVIQSDLATALIRKRTALGMTQTKFAEFLGVKQSQVSKWENGEINFTISKLVQLANALELDLTIALGQHKPFVSQAYRTPNLTNIIQLSDYSNARFGVSNTQYTSMQRCSNIYTMSDYEELKEM